MTFSTFIKGNITSKEENLTLINSIGEQEKNTNIRNYNVIINNNIFNENQDNNDFYDNFYA